MMKVAIVITIKNIIIKYKNVIFFNFKSNLQNILSWFKK